MMLIASGALLLSATGGAVAGGLITSSKIQDNTIRSQDVKNGTLKTRDLSAEAQADLAGQTGGQPGPVGPAGPQGPRGFKGDTGAPGAPGADGTDGTNGTNGMDGTNGTNGMDGMDGAPGVSGLEIVSNTGTFGQQTVDVYCPQGKRALGGGADTVAGTFLRVTEPAFNGFGWTATANSDNNGSNFSVGPTVTVYAICARVAP